MLKGTSCGEKKGMPSRRLDAREVIFPFACLPLFDEQSVIIVHAQPLPIQVKAIQEPGRDGIEEVRRVIRIPRDG